MAEMWTWAIFNSVILTKRLAVRKRLRYEISVMYSLFVSQLSGTIHAHLPMNVVRLGPRDPPFLTPLIAPFVAAHV